MIKKFIEAIKNSYIAYFESGSRSTKKLEPIHGCVARLLEVEFNNRGVDVQIYAKGYGSTKVTNCEKKIEGFFYPKNVDIAVFSGTNPLGAISLKFATGNYKQNANNYFEHMLGETANLRASGLVYGQITILRRLTPYFDKRGVIGRMEAINAFDINKYVFLNKSDIDNYSRPDHLAVVLVEMGDETVLEDSVRQCPDMQKRIDSINVSMTTLDNIKKIPGMSLEMIDDVLDLVNFEKTIVGFCDDVCKKKSGLL
jgi:hypothetical protein